MTLKVTLALQQRVKELEEAIRTHRSQKADDRCIEDDDKLYAVLKDGIKCDRRVGNKEEMFKNCKRFIENRCEEGRWPTYVELEAQRNELIVMLIQRHQRGKFYIGKKLREEVDNLIARLSVKIQ